MAMNGLLSIDCGNTTIDCLLHGGLGRRRFCSRGTDFDELRGFLSACAATRCVVASVNPASFEVLLRACPVPFVRLERAGHELPCPLALDYASPMALGVDRWVGALAAFRKRGASLVVDCGSATTFNLVDSEGVFRGGAIAPGLRALVEGMHAVTPLLPSPDLDATVALPARATLDAVAAGVLLGYCGAVDRLARSLVLAHGRPLWLVATGGNAERLLRNTELRLDHEPTLVHVGLAQLAAENPCAC